MASAQRVDIQELQREMMAAELREEKTRSSKALAGKTGARRPGTAGRGGDGREGLDSRPAPAGSHNPFDDGAPAGNYRPGRSVNVHEILKQEIFASTSASCDDHFEKNRPCPSTVYGVSDQYMVLDSFEKVETSRTHMGEFQFNFMVQGVTRNQAIGVKDRLDTIIGVQVSDFCIPLLPPDDFDPVRLVALKSGLSTLGLVANAPPDAGSVITTPHSQIPFCGRVTMFFKEIGLQSYSDADNRRHHFEFDAALAGPGQDGPPAGLGDRIHLTPLHASGYFLFTDPIQDVHGLTACFYNPGNTLRFPPDCLYGVEVRTDPNQLLQFVYSDANNLLNLEAGDRIYIRDFEAVDPAGNHYQTLNSYVSRPEGHQVGLGGYNLYGPPPLAAPPPTFPQTGTTAVFRLNPDISAAGLSPPVPANTALSMRKQVTVCIAKNRLRVPLRLRRVVDRLTNYVSP
jgi:hypothetical protein